jgi:REP element-mobilizing transposase RayT
MVACGYQSALGAAVFSIGKFLPMLCTTRTTLTGATRVGPIFEKVCADFEAQLAGMHGEDNHVHLLVNYPPKHSVSALVTNTTTDTARAGLISPP